LGHDAVSVVEQFPAFRIIVVPSSWISLGLFSLDIRSTIIKVNKDQK